LKLLCWLRDCEWGNPSGGSAYLNLDVSLVDARIALKAIMWLLAFAVLALFIGCDLRARGRKLCCETVHSSAVDQIGQNGSAVGAWISFAGGICLNIAVWNLF